jgi:hypothetical protein
MSEDQFLVPVRKTDIELGKPLPFAAYDSERNLLLNRGVVVNSEHQVDVLLQKGLYRERPRAAVSRADAAEDKPVDGGKPQGETLSFDAVKLMPGDTLQLQPLLEGQNERFSVQVIGVMKAKSLLVTAPVVDGKLIFVRDGQTYLVRAFSGLNVCAFKAKILKVAIAAFSLPAPVLSRQRPGHADTQSDAGTGKHHCRGA